MRYVLPWSGDRSCRIYVRQLGLLLGDLLPSCLPVWLIALAVIAAGLFLLQC